MTMKINTVLGGALLALICLVPTGTQAYETTSQTAVAFGPDKVLFTISYKFGFLNRDVYMPTLTKRNISSTSTTNTLGYSLVDGKNTTSSLGQVTAAVLSNAEIKDGRYYIPRGKNATFTLVAVFDKKLINTTDDLSLRITSLPFTLVDESKEINAFLQPPELNKYVTPKAQ